MKKILNVVSSLNSGGVENMLYNYYSRFDKNYFKIDFAVYDKKVGLIEEKLKNKDYNIFHITPRKQNIFNNLYDLFKIIKKGDYDIVYSHMNFISWIALLFAYICGVEIRISHAHGNKNKMKKETFFKKVGNNINRSLISMFATNFFACSIESGKYVYGNKWDLSDQKNSIIYNAINVSDFKFDVEKREYFRKKYDVEHKICLLHIGRFSEEKNHEFLLNLMQELDSDKYELICIGDGKDFNRIKEKFRLQHINNVVFLGSQNDVSKYYSMCDLFLLPSKYEGLGIVLIEAQASGLKCIASTGVPKETNITGNVKYIDLTDVEAWIETINDFKITNRNKLNNITAIISNAGYDINKESTEFEKKLIGIVEGK